VITLNPQLNILATVHMLEAYDEGKDWDCSCAACQDIRRLPELVEALQQELNKLPPKSGGLENGS
jgi:hypothetical protein